MPNSQIKKGMVLSGGAAKGAIEAGILKYIVENFGLNIDAVVGNSAGALNAYLYANLAETGSENDRNVNCKKMVAPWENLKFTEIAKMPFSDYLFGNFSSLLDNRVFKDYIKKYFSEEIMNMNIESGKIKILGVTTSELASGKAHLWYKSYDKNVDMTSSRWLSHRKDYLTDDYAIASAAIPVIFRAVKLKNLDGTYFQSHDGGVRMNTPLSPLFKSGCNKILVLYLGNVNENPKQELPSMIDSFYGLVNTFFFKNLEEDIIRAKTINSLLETINQQEYGGYRKVDVFVIRPQINVDERMVEIIKDYNLFTKLFIPKGLIKFLSVSSLFMDKIYTKPLIDLGYDLAKSNHNNLARFFDDSVAVVGEIVE